MAVEWPERLGLDLAEAWHLGFAIKTKGGSLSSPSKKGLHLSLRGLRINATGPTADQGTTGGRKTDALLGRGGPAVQQPSREGITSTGGIDDTGG